VGLGLELQNQQFMHRKQVVLVLLILLPVVELRETACAPTWIIRSGADKRQLI
jgi:hypothetical protein